MAVLERQLLLEGPIFHLHHYGRKGKVKEKNHSILIFFGKAGFLKEVKSNNILSMYSRGSIYPDVLSKG